MPVVEMRGRRFAAAHFDSVGVFDLGISANVFDGRVRAARRQMRERAVGQTDVEIVEHRTRSGLLQCGDELAHGARAVRAQVPDDGAIDLPWVQVRSGAGRRKVLRGLIDARKPAREIRGQRGVRRDDGDVGEDHR